MPRVWKFGDQINTDDILPGKYAPFMVGEDRFHLYAFAHLRPEFAKEVRPGDILVFGRNAGLGSSREYAPQRMRLTRNLLNKAAGEFWIAYDTPHYCDPGSESYHSM